ncbi:MAG: hypothetical protein EBX30_05980 [Betaproteobacteria bacterium]|nr:hypothetical protein [Betaproteobacteria bacterium]
MQLQSDNQASQDDRESLIVMLEPSTHSAHLEHFLRRVERVNSTYEDEVVSLTAENLKQIRDEVDHAKPGDHMVCLLLRFPNKAMIPYGSDLFPADDLDSIVRDVNQGELIYRHVHYTFNKLVAFTIGCVCNVKLLEEQLARAQAQLIQQSPSDQ